MTRYFIEPRTRKHDMDFYHLREDIENNYWIQN